MQKACMDRVAHVGSLTRKPCTSLCALKPPRLRWLNSGEGLAPAGGAHLRTSPPPLIKSSAKQSVVCRAQQQPSEGTPPALDVLAEDDLKFLVDAARLADSSAGLTQPHPNSACLLVDRQGSCVGSGFLWAQGTESAESKAVRQAGPAAHGATAYLNLEPGDCHGESAAVEALVRGGVARVVIGLRHPMAHFWGAAVEALRRAGVVVQVLGEDPCTAPLEAQAAALDACLAVNAPLLHRVATRKPMGVLKYAMTLDGKIATAQGHSAWVSSPQSRQRVFDVRARSDAVIVGGQTVRRDDPQLTTRRQEGHQPARIVMSRTLDLPENAKVWDVGHAPTIIMTQRGARRGFQRLMRSRGVEVVEFDFLTPEAVARYCAERGWLQCLWECGGVLAAPAVAGGAVHKVMAFVAPKLIGGSRAPTPLGDLGFVEMTQALVLEETGWEPSGPDLLMTGYLPQSGGLRALAAAAGVAPAALTAPGGSSVAEAAAVGGVPGSGARSATAAAGAAVGVAVPKVGSAAGSTPVLNTGRSKWVSAAAGAPVAEFYKAWDRNGCLSNFSAHPICMPSGPMTVERLRTLLSELPEALESCGLRLDASSSTEGQLAAAELGSGSRAWATVEHYYQAQKFAGVAHPDAKALVEAIAAASSPEEAAALGRRNQWCRPELLRDDWDCSKLAVMYAALRAKFASHAGPRHMLLSSVGVAAVALGPAGGLGVALPQASEQPQQQQQSASGPGTVRAASGALTLVESSPHDFFWGRGFDGSGQNMLGRLLMCLRDEMLRETGGAATSS